MYVILRFLVTASVVVTMARVALADDTKTIGLPALKSNDTWTYHVTQEKRIGGFSQQYTNYSVRRATTSNIYLMVQDRGSTQPPIELVGPPDWSRSRSIDGKETVVNKPLSFPLSQGKTWDVNYTELNPDREHKSEQFTTHYAIVGYEEIEVPAGKFNALKIEAEGKWVAEIVASRAFSDHIAS